jgi:hypothetical protein
VRPAVAPARVPPIAWHGGNSEANREALRWMLASENPSASRLAWFLQALVINNKAKRRQRLGVKNLADALRSGVSDRDKSKRLVLSLPWGPQYDAATGMVRIASTAAAPKGKPLPKALVSFVEDLIGGRLDPRSLSGHAGEPCPDLSVWPLLSDWLQHKDFDKTVAAQMRGSGKKPKTEAEVLAEWGAPRLYAELDGLRFYGARPRGEA